MNRNLSLALLLGLLFFVPFSSFGAGKLNFGIGARVPRYQLPAFAAEENGIWRKNGLEVQYIEFTGGGPLNQAIAAKAVDVAFHSPAPVFTAAAQGLPMMIVSDLAKTTLGIWVSGRGPLKELKDMQ